MFQNISFFQKNMSKLTNEWKAKSKNYKFNKKHLNSISAAELLYQLKLSLLLANPVYI